MALNTTDPASTAETVIEDKYNKIDEKAEEIYADAVANIESLIAVAETISNITVGSPTYSINQLTQITPSQYPVTVSPTSVTAQVIQSAVSAPVTVIETPYTITELTAYLAKQPTNPIADSEYSELGVAKPTFEYVEDTYDENTYAKLKTKIETLIEGKEDGLDSITRDAMFLWEQEKDAQINRDAKDKIASDWAKKGWGLPGGGIFNFTSQVDIEHQNKQQDKTRKITEESRKLAVALMQSGVTSGVQVEEVLRDFFNARMTRKLDAAKQVFQEGLAYFNGIMEKIKTKAQVYTAVVQAWAAETGMIAEGEKIQLEGLRVDAESAKNTAEIELMAARLEMESNKNDSDVEVAGKRLEMEAAKNEADVKLSGNRLEMESDKNASDIAMEENRFLLQESKQKADIELANLNLNLEKLKVQYGMDIEAVKTLATIAAHQLAAAWSAISISAHAQTSYSESYSGEL